MTVFDELEANRAAKLCAACEHEANEQGTCVFCGALRPDHGDQWEPPVRRARLQQTHEPLLPSDYKPIHCDFHDVNASGALLHVLGNVGGMLLQTIGERQLRAEFENLIALAPRIIQVKP